MRPSSIMRALSKRIFPSATPLLVPSQEFTRRKIQDRFVLAKLDVMRDFEEILDEKNLDKKSIEAGHKLIAARSTLSTRIHSEVQSLLEDEVTQSLDEIALEALKKRIEQNQAYIRFTTHPTEGQNLRAIREKDLIVSLQANLVQVLERETVSAEDVVKLARIASEAGVENSILEDAKSSGIPSFSEFSNLCATVRREIIRSFIEKPIHHVKKMTIQDERDLLLYHMDRCKKEVATIATRHPDLISVDDIKFSSWAFDMDGKPHVSAGNGVIFEHQSQEKFFDSLTKRLEDFADKIEIEGLDSSFFRSSVLEKIKEIHSASSGLVLIADEAIATETKINEILAAYESASAESLGNSFLEIKNYVKSSGCKTAQNGFTTREEIEKTNSALAEIKKMCSTKPSFAEDKIGTIARSFSEFSPETKRQVMCMMESALMHSRHEHIISQFDCELSSFKNTLELFEIAKQLPSHHASIPFFAEYYSEKSKEAGFDIYKQFFREPSIKAAEKSMVELSPLAEDEKTIPLLIGFTKAMLADKECVDYIAKSGGLIRQTRSNSDGSSSLGAQKVVMEYLKADIEIEKMVEAAGFRLKILQGIGANDLERMAPWTLKLLQSEFTAQGSDSQHQTRGRLTRMLLKDEDSSKKEFIDLASEYSAEEIEDLIKFYYKSHLSECGIEVEIDGKAANSGDLVHRGLIPATVVKKLGNLSSRPDSRTGDVGVRELQENTPDVWDPSVHNRNMRRIGAISLQRASGVSTFSMAPFFDAPKDFNPQLVHDFNKIPLIRNINISAIFALGIADIKSFILTNGIDFEFSEASIPETAESYKKFLEIYKKDGKEAAKEYGEKHGFDTPEGIRAGELCSKINGLRFVLENAIRPLILNSSEEIKKEFEEVFAKAREGSIKKYDGLVKEAFAILSKDPSQDLETRQTAACAGQQVANVLRPGNFYDTRARLISGAHKALSEGNDAAFNKTCEQLAIITRSAGNPASPGRKTDELLRYFNDSFNKTAIPMRQLIGNLSRAPSAELSPRASSKLSEASREATVELR